MLVVAKTETAMTHLSKQFFDKTSERKYFALVWGDVKADSGTVEGNIGRHPRNRLQMTVFDEERSLENPQLPITKYWNALGMLPF